MLRRGLIIVSALFFASSVLFTSIFRTALPQYVFSQAGVVQGATDSAIPEKIEYPLPYPGILPDSILWSVKALRDRLWLLTVRDPMKRAEINLLFADKRIGMARVLIEGGKPELGVVTAQKAEQYLADALTESEKASQRGMKTDEFLNKLAKAALKHDEILVSLVETTPEQGRPMLNESLNYPRQVYEKVSQNLNELGQPVPMEQQVEPSPSPEPSASPATVAPKAPSKKR